MAPKQNTQATVSEAIYADGHRKLKDWTARFYRAIGDSEGYAKVHMRFFRDFEMLSDEVRGSAKRSIVPYVAPVFNHTASQGYRPEIHYDPLFQGMSAYCQQLPPPTWIPPPDQEDKSPTPSLPPLPPSPSGMKKAKAGAPSQPTPYSPPLPPLAKGRSRVPKLGSREKPAREAAPPVPSNPAPKDKAPLRVMKATKVKKSTEFVEDESDGDFKDGNTSDEGKGPSKPVDRELVKCTSCEKDGSPCLINPSTVGKSSRACHECFTHKRKCSLYKRSGEGARKRKPAAAAVEEPGKRFAYSIIES